MSRVAKNPIVLPQGVDVAVGNEEIVVKGPLGTIKFSGNPAVSVVMDAQSLVCRELQRFVRYRARHPRQYGGRGE